jgi:hypothetical protein
MATGPTTRIATCDKDSDMGGAYLLAVLRLPAPQEVDKVTRVWLPDDATTSLATTATMVAKVPAATKASKGLPSLLP